MSTDRYDYLPKEFVEEPYYSVAEAMALTGYSATKFRYEPNKRRLDELGSDCSERVWRIPRSALIEMRWLSEDAPLRPELEGSEEAGGQRSSVLRIKDLYAQVKSLETEKDALLQRLAVAEARVEEKSAEIERLLGLLHSKS